MTFTCPTDFLCNAQWLKPLEMPIRREVVINSFEQKFVGFGSCFATNLKAQLDNFHFTFWWNRDVCAHYSSRTLLQTLRRAVGLEEHQDDEFLQINGDPEELVLINYFKIRFFGPTALDQARSMRAHLDAELIREIKDGDIFVLTLGNTKVFKPKDRATLACTVYGLGPDDYEFFPLSAADVEQDLNQILDIFLQIRGGRPLKLFVSISPQRYLYSRFAHECSTLEDNCLMKAMLRMAAAAFTIARKADGAIYFPAYEMVTEELRLYETLSTYDHMHINQDLTPRYVVKKFLLNHASDSVIKNLPLIENLSELVSETNLDLSRGAKNRHPKILAEWMSYFERLLDASEEIAPKRTWFAVLDSMGNLDYLNDVKALCSKRILSPAVEKVISEWSHNVTK